MSYRPTVLSIDQLEQAAQTGVDLAIDDRTTSLTSGDPAAAAAVDPFGILNPTLSGYASR